MWLMIWMSSSATWYLLFAMSASECCRQCLRHVSTEVSDATFERGGMRETSSIYNSCQCEQESVHM